mmetsp:Transcript_28015/g.59748  ORF Transcript_28015/g.59748 Transcript_28015/m.59748 type:complete len:81 (+) Transcript_28015:525-767(+)
MESQEDRRHSEKSMDDFSIDDAEYVMELKTPSPSKSKSRRRLDTGDSVDSDRGEVTGSLERIEKFINELSPKSDDKKEIV